MEETHRGFAELQHRLQTPHPGHRWSGSDGLSNQYSSQYNWPDQRMGLWFAGLPTSKQSADANSQNSFHICITVNNLALTNPTSATPAFIFIVSIYCRAERCNVTKQKFLQSSPLRAISSPVLIIMVSYHWQESPMVPSVRHNGEQMIKLVSDDQFFHGQKIFLPFI